jgi:hypothetical protein
MKKKHSKRDRSVTTFRLNAHTDAQRRIRIRRIRRMRRVKTMGRRRRRRRKRRRRRRRGGEGGGGGGGGIRNVRHVIGYCLSQQTRVDNVVDDVAEEHGWMNKVV